MAGAQSVRLPPLAELGFERTPAIAVLKPDMSVAKTFEGEIDASALGGEGQVDAEAGDSELGHTNLTGSGSGGHLYQAHVLGRTEAEAGSLRGSILRLTESPEKVFLVLALFWGLALTVVTPPFQVPDENRHFYRAYQLAEGQITGVIHEGKPGGFLPENLLACSRSTHHLRWHPERKHSIGKTLELFELPLERDRRVFWPFVSVRYSPIPYLPQSLAIAVGNAFQSPPLVMMYAGRICNLMVWILLVFAAIRIAPVFKWVFFLLALTPMTLYLAASLSADGLTIALAFLSAAFFLACALDDRNEVRRSDFFVMLGLMVGLSLCKSIYFLTACLYLLIPIRRIGSRRRYVTLFLVLFLGSLSVSAAWSFSVMEFATPQKQGVVPQESIETIVAEPVEHVERMFRTVIQASERIGVSFVGNLGWSDTPLPDFHWMGWGILLMLVALVEGKDSVVISLRCKLVLFGIPFLTTLMILTLSYVYWGTPSDHIIPGIQGRYFIPIAPMILLLLYNRRLQARFGYFRCVLVALCTLSLGNALASLTYRFYL